MRLTTRTNRCTMCTMPVSTSPRINMRLSVEDDAVIRLAAEASGSTVTEFVVSAARLAAERKLAEQRVWRLDAAAWDQVSATIDADPRPEHVVQIADLFARAGSVDPSNLR